MLRTDTRTGILPCTKPPHQVWLLEWKSPLGRIRHFGVFPSRQEAEEALSKIHQAVPLYAQCGHSRITCFQVGHCTLPLQEGQ